MILSADQAERYRSKYVRSPATLSQETFAVPFGVPAIGGLATQSVCVCSVGNPMRTLVSSDVLLSELHCGLAQE